MITTRYSFALLLFSISFHIVFSAAKMEEDSVKIFAVAYPIVAYVLESEKNVATTYLVACPKSLPTAACPFSQPYTLIEGPKTVYWSFIASDQRLTVDCALKGTTSMGCHATGRAGPSGPMTTDSYTWKGEKASTLFRKVELVTNTKSLMTHRAVPLNTITSTAVTKTKGGKTTPTLPVVVTRTVVPSPVDGSSLDVAAALTVDQSSSGILDLITAAATSPTVGVKQISSPSASASTSGSVGFQSRLWFTSSVVFLSMLAIVGI